MAKAFLLTEEDRKIITEMIRRERGQFVNPVGRYNGSEILQDTPDVYVARTPPEGIPALLPAAGTGTGDFDVPGEAECDIYQIREDSLGPYLFPVTGVSRRVFNLASGGEAGTGTGTDSAEDASGVIAGDTYIPIHRTKFGAWIAGGVGSGGSSSALTVKEDDGTPTVNNVFTLTFESDDFVVTDLGSGEAKVDAIAGSLDVEESDGTPSVTGVDKIIVDSADFLLTDEGSNDVSLNTVGMTTTTKQVVTDVNCNSGVLSLTKETITITRGLVKSIS